MDDFYTQSKNEARIQRVQLPICDRTLTTEVSGEVSLPDYQPEIKRLLRVSATVQPPSHYVGGGAMEFSGTVDYCIFYTGNDGQMYCFPTSENYAVRAPLEAGADFDLNDALTCYAVCEPEAIISRVSGPRRMSVKCRLRAHVKAYGSCVIEERHEGTLTAGGEERLLCETQTSVQSYVLGTPFVLSDEILPERDGEDTTEYRIISGDAHVLISEAVCEDGRVNCRGDLLLKLLLGREEGDALPVTIRRKLPIDHIVPLDGAATDSEATVIGHCTELDMSMEDGRVLCEVEIVPEVCARRNEAFTYTSDLYAVDRDSECEMKTYHLPRTLRCINGNLTQSESLSTDELGIDAACRVADIYGTAQIDGVETERGRYVVNGKCRYTLVLMCDGEMSAKEFERPFRYTADGTADAVDRLNWEGNVQVISARAHLDAERMAIDAELGICLYLSTEDEIRMVSSLKIGETLERPAGQMLLCYPTPADTLWSIGKRYHTALDALAQGNRLPTAPRADAPTSLGGAKVVAIG